MHMAATSLPHHHPSAGLPTPTATSSTPTRHLRQQQQVGRVVGEWARHIGVGKWVGRWGMAVTRRCATHMPSRHVPFTPPLLGGQVLFINEAVFHPHTVSLFSFSPTCPHPLPLFFWGLLFPHFPSTRRCPTQPPSHFIALSPLLLGGFIFLRQGCVLPTQSYSFVFHPPPHWWGLFLLDVPNSTVAIIL